MGRVIPVTTCLLPTLVQTEKHFILIHLQAANAADFGDSPFFFLEQVTTKPVLPVKPLRTP